MPRQRNQRKGNQAGKKPQKKKTNLPKAEVKQKAPNVKRKGL